METMAWLQNNFIKSKEEKEVPHTDHSGKTHYNTVQFLQGVYLPILKREKEEGQQVLPCWSRETQIAKE